MKIRKRLTRQESKEVTRMRLVEAMERAFGVRSLSPE